MTVHLTHCCPHFTSTLSFSGLASLSLLGPLSVPAHFSVPEKSGFQDLVPHQANSRRWANIKFPIPWGFIASAMLYHGWLLPLETLSRGLFRAMLDFWQRRVQGRKCSPHPPVWGHFLSAYQKTHLHLPPIDLPNELCCKVWLCDVPWLQRRLSPLNYYSLDRASGNFAFVLLFCFLEVITIDVCVSPRWSHDPLASISQVLREQVQRNQSSDVVVLIQHWLVCLGLLPLCVTLQSIYQ